MAEGGDSGDKPKATVWSQRTPQAEFPQKVSRGEFPGPVLEPRPSKNIQPMLNRSAEKSSTTKADDQPAHLPAQQVGSKLTYAQVLRMPPLGLAHALMIGGGVSPSSVLVLAGEGARRDFPLSPRGWIQLQKMGCSCSTSSDEWSDSDSDSSLSELPPYIRRSTKTVELRAHNNPACMFG
ncbi:hypothetical protein D4764_17G0001480 [Takifugu flavidus]|uniref:Uncharacterized protein n=1 Tax=Takifugu flavidus TaxID=433684 RepID=A0A5C6NUH8_9TELE|nr:hypothetical protein D4764_17G0001480 [Takifugu flavidus]